jgi:hypothetical protein
MRDHVEHDVSAAEVARDGQRRIVHRLTLRLRYGTGLPRIFDHGFAPEDLEGGLVHDRRMVAVHTDEFPVAAKTRFVHARVEKQFAGRRSVDHEVDLRGGVAEVVAQRHGVGVDAAEQEAAIALDAR